MTYNELQNAKVAAMKSGDKVRIKVLNDIIVLVQKEQTKGKTKIEATDDMVAQCATKAQKTLEEMVATCPDSGAYAERKADYLAQLTVVKEYAPQMITDAEEIKNLILDILGSNEIELVKKNKGLVMKAVMPILKGKVDMAVANQVISKLLN
jgi:uncharacterized protein YqeY